MSTQCCLCRDCDIQRGKKAECEPPRDCGLCRGLISSLLLCGKLLTMAGEEGRATLDLTTTRVWPQIDLSKAGPRRCRDLLDSVECDGQRKEKA